MAIDHEDLGDKSRHHHNPTPVAGKGVLVCACVRGGDMFCVVQYSKVATHFAHLAAYFVILLPVTVY